MVKPCNYFLWRRCMTVNQNYLHITIYLQGMEECKELKLAKSIGVSNFNPKQLQKIIDLCRIRPAVNEV